MIQPKSATLEITQRCNLRCKTCFANSTTKINSVEIQIDILRILVDRLVDMGVRSFLLGGGEPTLHKSFITLLKHFRDRGIKPGIATNGLLLSGTFCRNLSELGIRHNVYVSLDGADASTYQKVRNSDSFYKVIQGIKRLRKYGIRFAISMVVVRHNFSKIPQMYKLSKSLSASFLNLIRFNLEGRGISNANELHIGFQSFRELCRPYLRRWGGAMGFFGENCIIPLDPELNISFPSENDMRGFVVIGVTGDVKIGRASGGIIIGNCFKDDFRKIWHGPTAKHYLKDMTPEKFSELIKFRRENRLW